MPGIYIHIPFCRQACTYCDFHFSTSLKNKDAFLAALKKEINLQKDYLQKKNISSVYFGGGTPSLLTKDELLQVFDELDRYFHIDADAEVTLEANPDDLTRTKLKELEQTPVNRLSIGIQSFYEDDLRFMNRAHSACEAEGCVKLAQDSGFENITIDLIYGVPGMSHARWGENLDKAFTLNVPHISAYCLTVEPHTALADMVKKKKVSAMDEKQSAEQFMIMLGMMKENNFIQYEISNFGKEGFFSRHNSSYWKGEYYLGLGPSAHSFDGESRQWNVRNNPLYIKNLMEGRLDFDRELLSKEQQYNEYILTTLRTMWGSSLDYIQSNFGNDFKTYCLAGAGPYVETGEVVQKENKLILSDKGKLVADRIAGDLFMLN